MNLVGTRRLEFGSWLSAARHDGSFLLVLFRLSSARGAVAIGNSLYMFAYANTQSVLCTVAIGNVLYMFAYANTQSGAEGHVSGTADYDIFGEPVTETGVFAANSTIVFAYAGKPYDPGTGLSDYGFRDYAPTLARFTTVDPIRDGSNWYAYCNADPVNYVDAWGLDIRIISAPNVDPKYIAETETMLDNIRNSKTLAAVMIKELDSSPKTVRIYVNLNGDNDSTPGDDETATDAEKVASADRTGGDVYIRFDPTDVTALNDGTPSIPEATLAHEVAGHGYFQATGKNPYNTNDYDDDYPRETLAGSIENEYRYVKGWPQRKTYGYGAVGPNNKGWDLDQYPQSYSASSTNTGGLNSACSNH